MMRRLSRKSRISSTEVSVYTPEPKYAVQTDEERRRSRPSQEQITQQPSTGEVFRDDDETSMTLEEIKLKRKVSVSQSGKVHRKSTRNSVVDIFGDNSVQHCDMMTPPPPQSEASRHSENKSDLQQYYRLDQRF